MKKEQVDMTNRIVFIADSKTPTGIFEVPLTVIELKAFQDQFELAGPGPWLFPSCRKIMEHQSDFKRPGKGPFRALVFRTSGCTRTFDVGNSSERWRSRGRVGYPMLRQTDAKVFEKYSRMKGEALTRLNRRAGDSAPGGFDIKAKNEPVSIRF